MFLSTNNGASWTEVNNGLTNTSVNALAVSGTNIFAGTWLGGVFLSMNNGASWTEVNNGLTNTWVYALAVSGTNIFAGTDGNGVFLSTNNGTSWTQTGLTNIGVNALAVSGTNIFAGTDGGGVFLSTNNGRSWTQVNNGLTNSYVRSLAVSDTNIFAGTEGGGVFLSTNNGTSWTQVNEGLENTRVGCLAISGRYILAGTWGFGVWRKELTAEVVHVINLILSIIFLSVSKVAVLWVAALLLDEIVLLSIYGIYKIITGKKRAATHEYRIYTRVGGGIRAVKRGWNWPAFFFSWIWAFTKGLIAIGVGVMLSPIILGGIFSNIDTELASYVIIIATLVSDFWLGAKGNKFVEDNLTKKGFKFAGTVNAATAEGALATFLSNHSEEDRERL